jgi:hypothetical protein
MAYTAEILARLHDALTVWEKWAAEPEEFMAHRDATVAVRELGQADPGMHGPSCPPVYAPARPARSPDGAE